MVCSEHFETKTTKEQVTVEASLIILVLIWEHFEGSSWDVSDKESDLKVPGYIPDSETEMQLT